MAALTSPIVGNGTTLSMTGLGQTTFVRKISGMENTLAKFETSDLATTEFKTYKKDTLAEPGKITVEFYWIGTDLTIGNVNTCTVTYPSAGSVAGTAIVTKKKLPDAANGEALLMTCDIDFDGYTGPAVTPA